MNTRTTAAFVAALLCLSTSACSMGSDSTATHSNDSSASASNGSETPSSSTTATLSAAEIWNKSQERIRSCTWLSVAANGTMEGELVKLNMAGSTKNEVPMKGTVTFDKSATAEIRRIDSTLYMKGSKDFFKYSIKASGKTPPPDAALETIANRWLKGDSQELGVGASLSVKSLVSSLTDDSGSAPDTVTEETFNGQPTYRLDSRDGDSRAWVSADGTYDILKLKNLHYSPTDYDEMDEMTFSSCNKPSKVEAPAGAISLPKGSSAT